MKIVLVILMLTSVPQNAEASIFDSFKQAMSSITTSVEKMITSVASDVKETIDCTLLALEHSLSITLFKEYNKKCKGINNQDFIHTNGNFKEAVHTGTEHVNEDYHEFKSNSKIKMKRICGIPEDELDLDKIRKVLLHNSGRLRIMDDFLKNQLATLPQNLKIIDSILSADTECTVEDVLNKIKALIETVKMVQDQKVGDEIEDVLKEMLHLLNGDDLVGASENTNLESGFSNAAAATSPAYRVPVLEPMIKEETYHNIATSYEAPLVVANAQIEQTNEYDDSQDMKIAEDSYRDYVNIENFEPMPAQMIPINSNTNDGDVDDIDPIVEYIMETNNNSGNEDDGIENENLTPSSEDGVFDYPSFSGFNDPMPSYMNSDENAGSDFLDDDIMRKITEILRDQPHTELVMGNLRT